MIDYRKPLPMMREHPPCKDCTERFTACSDRCPKDERGEYGYKAWKAKLYEVQKNRSAYNRMNRREQWELKNS